MHAFEYDGISIKNRRSTNMDSMLLKERSIGGKNAYFMVVCDGVGSTEDGAYASRTAVHFLSDWLNWLPDASCIGPRLQDAVQKVNLAILDQATQQQLNTASTLSALLLIDDRFYIVHAGDSRIYGYRDGTLELLTHDHVENGRLTSYIGRTENPELFYNEGSAVGMRFLLCSDGLYKRMEPSLIQQELAQLTKKNIKHSLQRMTQYVTERGESDNISIAVLISES